MYSKSKIFLFLMVAFLVGVAFGTFIELNIAFIFMTPAFAGIFLLVFQNKYAFVLFFLSIVFSLGFFWCQFYEARHDISENFKIGNVELKGIVIEQPDFKNGIQRIIIKTPKEGRILLITQRFPEYEYGDVLKVSGAIERPANFGSFDYISYLAKDNIHFTMQNPEIVLEKRGEGNIIKQQLFSLKDAFERNINSSLASPESDFLNGILFGAKSDMPKKLSDNFIKTGTAHIIALSGFNVTIIVIFLAWIFGYFSSNAKAVVISAIVAISLFVIMTGASSSVVRAALMGTVLLLAKYYGRAQYSLNALVFAALIMVILNPKILVFDVSFQLSFLATAGILYIYPYFLGRFKKVPNFFKLRDTISATCAAQVAVLPILLFNFHQVSLISPIVNVLVIPLIPFAMFLGFLIGLFGFIFLPLAKVFAFFAWFILAYQINMIEFFGSLPFASLSF